MFHLKKSKSSNEHNSNFDIIYYILNNCKLREILENFLFFIPPIVQFTSQQIKTIPWNNLNLCSRNKYGYIIIHSK